MRDLIEYANECMEELDVINVPYTKPIAWVVNKRAQRRLGQCAKRANGYTIEISYRLLADDVDEIALKDTIQHELLHTIPGCMNHGDRWQRYAAYVNREYGYHVSRCADASVYTEKYNVAASTYKYAVQCQKCGAIVQRMRATSVITNPGRYRCARCGGRFERIDYTEIKTAACNAS